MKFLRCWQISKDSRDLQPFSVYIFWPQNPDVWNLWQRAASYCLAKTTFTFQFSILTLSNAFLSINNREMKSESGFILAMASQPFRVWNPFPKWADSGWFRFTGDLVCWWVLRNWGRLRVRDGEMEREWKQKGHFNVIKHALLIHWECNQ